jgi:hypothetical protein
LRQQWQQRRLQKPTIGHCQEQQQQQQRLMWGRMTHLMMSQMPMGMTRHLPQGVTHLMIWLLRSAQDLKLTMSHLQRAMGQRQWARLAHLGRIQQRSLLPLSRCCQLCLS